MSDQHQITFWTGGWGVEVLSLSAEVSWYYGWSSSGPHEVLNCSHPSSRDRSDKGAVLVLTKSSWLLQKVNRLLIGTGAEPCLFVWSICLGKKKIIKNKIAFEILLLWLTHGPPVPQLVVCHSSELTRSLKAFNLTSFYSAWLSGRQVNKRCLYVAQSNLHDWSWTRQPNLQHAPLYWLYTRMYLHWFWIKS